VMEPVGLAVGIAGLAGLFSVCLDVVEKVDSYKNFGVEFRSVIAQFDGHKLRFRKWGKGVGIEKDILADKHHKDLDDPQTFASVEKILSSIQEFCLSADNTRLTLEPTSKFSAKSSLRDSLVSEGHTRYQMDKESSSKWKKMEWAFRKKARFVAQVEEFRMLVQALYDLVPPDGTEGSHASDGFGSLNGIYFSLC
jgi:Prion-inhibition and propagation